MARNLAPTYVSEERGSTSIAKTTVYLEDAGDGFVQMTPDSPGDYSLVDENGDNTGGTPDGFWHMTSSPGSEDTAILVEVSGFVHLLG